MQTRYRRPSLIGTGLVLILTAIPISGAAQSLTSGSLNGVVQDSTGAPLFEADVHAVGTDLGLRRTTRTSRRGTFSLGILPPGRYDLLVERLGFRPRWIRGVVVKSGEATKVDAALTAAAPPIDRADETRWPERSVGWSAGLGQSVPEYELRTRLGRRQTGSLTELAAFSGADNEIAGLPGWLAGFAADGIALRGLAHPQLAVDPLAAGSLVLGSIGGLAVLPALSDVEWPGFAGGLLNVRSRPGTESLGADLFGAWSGTALAGSKYFDPAAVSHTSILGGAVVGAPIVRDSMHALVGIELERLELPQPGLPIESPNPALASYARASAAQRDVWSAFGRFDWRLARAHSLSVRGSATGLPEFDQQPSFESGSIPASVTKGRDASAGATLLSEWSAVMASEFRLGIQLSHRDYGVPSSDGDAVPSTLFARDGLRLAVNNSGSGAFDRTGIRLMQTLHFIGPVHRVKVGLSGDLWNYKQTYAYGSRGEFVLSDWRTADGLRGAFVATVGPTPEVQVSDRVGALFAQDIWTPLAGLEVTGGVRLEVQKTAFDWVPNPQWLAATALEAQEPANGLRISPRAALRWDLQDQHRVVVSAAAGIDHGPTNEAPLAEVASHQGLVEARHGFGPFPGWPAAPAGTAAEQGRLAYLGPDYRPPRTMRGALGLEVSPRGGTILQFGFLLRRTEFLPRRHDLNRLTSSVGADQHGRALWGQLTQLGSVITAVPGSNRRFPEFAEVFALETDGVSDYQGLFVGIRHESGPFGFSAGYTRSSTTDNWIGERAAHPNARLAPQLTQNEVGDWADGTSDFDVPDRAFASARVRLPTPLPATIAIVYTYRSGYPFTPNVQPGVDANGDGSIWNDPAYIDDSLSGASEVLGAWPCVRNQVRRFAERNSCRGEAMQSLDARLSVDLLRLGSHTSVLTVDVLNLIEPGAAVVDPAFVRIDPAGTLVPASAGGGIQVPYMVNANFGKPLSRHTPGRMVYIGLRIHR